MPLAELSVSGYRSVRRIRLKLRRINVITGPSGCGKSNLYNAVLLLAKAAVGDFARAIAEQGGMPSVLWAGVQKRFGKRPEPRRVVLSLKTDQFGFELQCGLPENGPSQERRSQKNIMAPPSQFLLDPEMKSESAWMTTARGGRVVLLERDGALATLRNAAGRMSACPPLLHQAESVLSQIHEPHLYPDLWRLRSEMLRWRFYHCFRTDPGAPLRHPRLGVMTPVLAGDGADLAAALQTIVEIGDAGALREAVACAFRGTRIEVASDCGRFRVMMHLPGIPRPLEANELSDGTLRYLCLIAALLSPRPPLLLGLSEPETGIHPDLVPVLARMMANAARHSQLWITTRSPALAEKIAEFSGDDPIRLAMTDGETRLA